MFRHLRHKPVAKKPPGAAPGSLHHAPEHVDAPLRIQIMAYSTDVLEENPQAGEADALGAGGGGLITWINVDGTHGGSFLEGTGRRFEIHPLVLEDIQSAHQRPKVEEYPGHLFLVFKMLTWNEGLGCLESEQVALVLLHDTVLSFQEDKEGDVFDEVRRNLRNGHARLRSSGADYLAYRLLDAVVDHYFIVLEKLGDRVELLEEELLTNPTSLTLEKIYGLKRELIFMRRHVWPLRETLASLERMDTPLIAEATRVYLRDVADHTVRVLDTMESYREMAAGMLETYLSSVSHRLNEVMKVLTVISTIFIPLTFIVGVYGMNFQFMPELHWRFGYLLVWIAMMGTGFGMWLFFRKRTWL